MTHPVFVIGLMTMNRIDRFSNLTDSEVQVQLEEESLPFAVLMMQIQGDFNFGTVVRNANAFGAREAFYYGPKKKWDRRSAVGVYHYTRVTWLPESENLDEILKLKETYPNFVAVDIIPGTSSPLEAYTWKPNTLLLFGEERLGLSKEVLNLCEDTIHITQRGSVRSINVGTASGITMFDFGRRYEENSNA